ncbi:hypothetical protein KIN20_033236 [Parelaphostrongylus tenuis]|uniref:Uncharacterized protein n=1 Tax=Parelaphostrongylus tenuis TaxID=148309 RepID=A0AAD5R7U8_PARTN|nr:hypothetical protein KIN20_033236 [Parelaphostrongylus tenuis]
MEVEPDIRQLHHPRPAYDIALTSPSNQSGGANVERSRQRLWKCWSPRVYE